VAVEGTILNFRTLTQFSWLIIITKAFPKQQKLFIIHQKILIKIALLLLRNG
jgi:hypothetical protein